MRLGGRSGWQKAIGSHWQEWGFRWPLPPVGVHVLRTLNQDLTTKSPFNDVLTLGITGCLFSEEGVRGRPLTGRPWSTAGDGPLSAETLLTGVNAVFFFFLRSVPICINSSSTKEGGHGLARWKL